MMYGRTLHKWAQFGRHRTNPSAKHPAGKARQKHRQDRAGSEEDDKTLDDFMASLRLELPYARLMTTYKGYVSLGHNQSEVRDSVCLLRGCTAPMNLRPCAGGYRVVGECYVHGLGDGGFWTAQDESAMQEFHSR